MISEQLDSIRRELHSGVSLVAVSKYHPVEAIREAYAAGQRVFGESHVQELVAKHAELPADIEWHFIGHLQTNKVKYLAPFVSLIHAVDTVRLLMETDRQGRKCGRVIDVLLQIHVAAEETKYGFLPGELLEMLEAGQWRGMSGVRIVGLMAMATHTEDEERIAADFARVKTLFDQIKGRFFADSPSFCELSMGMSGDYRIAQEHGSTMVRVGSLIFGERAAIKN